MAALDRAVMRRLVVSARSATLATVTADGRPHLVPIAFALDGERLWSAVDRKPMRTSDLARLRNIRARPQVSVLVDHYDEDWARLWWVRLDGTATVHAAGHRPALGLLADRYPQYRQAPPDGPVIEIAIHTWRGWSAAGG